MSPELETDDIRERRKAARRTAWILAVVVVLIFTAFLLTGVIGR